jgi:acyl-CoA thioesterase I
VPVIKQLFETGRPPVKGLTMAMLLLMPAVMANLIGCGDSAPVATVPAAAPPTDGQVILMGDSITYNWSGQNPAVPLATTIYSLIPDVIDMGISGNTSCAMWDRFDRDVVAYKPRVLIILAGTNDVRSGLTSTKCVAAMVAVATQEIGARVVVATIPPSPALDQNAIEAWNNQLDALVWEYRDSRYSVQLADYWTAMYPGGATEFISDGVHPNQLGYDMMWSVLSRYVQ